jgi:hypothetical protein
MDGIEMDNLQQMIDEGLEFAKTYLKNNLQRNWLRIRHLTGNGLEDTEIDCTLIGYEAGDCDGYEEFLPVWTKDGWYRLKVIDILDVTVLRDYILLNTEGPSVKQQYKGKIADRGEHDAQEVEDLEILGVKV